MIVMGLGNPGPVYRNTRHNVGYLVVDLLMQELGLQFKIRPFSRVYHARQDFQEAGQIIFIRWSGYMNHSGQTIPFIRKKTPFSPENFFVIVDNIDLPPGALRLKTHGGSAGHNGLKSIIDFLGDGHFNRIYIGVGRPQPGMSVVEHVLGRYGGGPEGKIIEDACGRAVQALKDIHKHGVEKVAETLNQRQDP